MKYVLVSFFLSVVLVIIGFYITSSLSPFVDESVLGYAETQNLLTDNEVISNIDEMIDKGIIFRMLNWKNLSVFFLVFGGAFTALFSSVHIFIDKLFFKRLNESPNFFAAIRRGLLICFVAIGLFFLRLILNLYWYNAIALILLAVFIEIFTSGIIKNNNEKENSNRSSMAIR